MASHEGVFLECTFTFAERLEIAEKVLEALDRIAKEATAYANEVAALKAKEEEENGNR